MCFFRKKENKIEIVKDKIDFILALYLNQRFVYDILAIKNDGFTEFYEVKDQNANSNSVKNSVSAEFATNNDFSLITASMVDSLETTMGEDKNKEKTYKKTHTPTSLFMQAYNYLKRNNEIKIIKNFSDLDNLKSGEFVELNSTIELNTIIDFLEDLSKALEIIEAFSELGDSKKGKQVSPNIILKNKVDNILKILEDEKDGVKYGICRIQEYPVVLKLNKEYFINKDYAEIRNGEFRIIGKILEIVPNGKEILLNRENAIGMFDSSMFNPIKNAIEEIPNIKFQKFEDKILGKTCVIMPIAIGI